MKRIIFFILLLALITSSALILTSCGAGGFEDVDAKLLEIGFTHVDGADADDALRATVNNFISLGKLDTDIYEEYRDKIVGGMIYERTTFFAYVIEFSDGEYLTSFVGEDKIDALKASGYVYGNVLVTTNSLAVVKAVRTLD